VYNAASPTRNLWVRKEGPGMAIGLAMGTVATLATRIWFGLELGADG